MTSALMERGKFPQQRAVQAGTELRVADPPGQQQQPTSPRHRLESARWAHTALQRCLHPSCLAHGEASSPESPVYLWACCGVCHCDCGGAHVLPWATSTAAPESHGAGLASHNTQIIRQTAGSIVHLIVYTCIWQQRQPLNTVIPIPGQAQAGTVLLAALPGSAPLPGPSLCLSKEGRHMPASQSRAETQTEVRHKRRRSIRM